MRSSILLFLFTSILFAQNAPLKLTLLAVISKDSIPTERIFTINYSLENQTSQKLEFFLSPQVLTSNVSGALENFPYFTILEEAEMINANGILAGNFDDSLPKDLINLLKKAKSEDDRSKIYGTYFLRRFQDDSIPEKKHKRERKELLDQLFSMQPNETKTFSVRCTWHKDRYFTHSDIEYYVDEKAKHYIQLTINLFKEPFKDRLETDEFTAMMNNKNFISGVFTSNKMEINFFE